MYASLLRKAKRGKGPANTRRLWTGSYRGHIYKCCYAVLGIDCGLYKLKRGPFIPQAAKKGTLYSLCLLCLPTKSCWRARICLRVYKGRFFVGMRLRLFQNWKFSRSGIFCRIPEYSVASGNWPCLGHVASEFVWAQSFAVGEKLWVVIQFVGLKWVRSDFCYYF